MFFKYLISIFILTFCVGIGVLYWAGQSISSNEDTLIVGTETNYPPYEFVDSKGKVVGFDVDVIEAIAKKLNKKLVIKSMEFDSLILALQQERIDLCICGMNITPNRLKAIQMVPYHGETQTTYALMFWNKIPDGIQTLQDIIDQSTGLIALQTGSVQDIYMQKHFPKVVTRKLEGALNPLLDVKYGKSIAALVNTDVSKHLKAKYPEIKVIEVPLTPEDFVLGEGIGIKKENLQLANEIKQIIAQFKLDGTLEKYHQKWFKELQ